MAPRVKDSDLLRAHLNGDERAFPELVTRYRPGLLKFINRFVHDREKAEDLVQEVFLQVHRHAGRVDPTKKFSVWLFTIAGNRARSELVHRKYDRLVFFQSVRKNNDDFDLPLQYEDEKVRPDVMMEQRDLFELVEGTIDRLNVEHKIAFIMREREGRSYREIAELTGVGRGTVKSRLHRAREAFATIIEPHID